VPADPHLMDGAAPCGRPWPCPTPDSVPAAPPALTVGYRPAFLISAILVGTGTVVAAVALETSPPRPLGTLEEVHLAEEELSAASEPFPH